MRIARRDLIVVLTLRGPTGTTSEADDLRSRCPTGGRAIAAIGGFICESASAWEARSQVENNETIA